MAGDPGRTPVPISGIVHALGRPGAHTGPELGDRARRPPTRPLTSAPWFRATVVGMTSLADLDELALALPEVERGTAWGDRPAYKVHGKAFVLFRGPRKDAIDPDTRQPMDDVIVFDVPDQTDKDALVGSDGPWFTTPHFDGYRAVLLRERHLPRVERDELREVVTDAWLARAPKGLAKAWLAEHDPSR